MIKDTPVTCDLRIRKPAAALAVGVILALMIATPASGRRQESQLTVIRAGVVIDGTGRSPRENVIIAIRDGHIVETRLATQADATHPNVIDLTGFYVLPGLIDVHAHLTMSHDPDLDYGELSGPASGILGVMHAKRTLMAGFTTVRDPFGPYYADVALRNAIAAGWVEGPRMFVSGPGLTMTALTQGEALGLDPSHLAKARAVSGRFRQSFQLAHAAGVKIAFGTDAGVFPHGENARQFALYVTLGMTPMEALQSATRTAAQLIGVSEGVGTIEAGKRADLIAVASNPLKDIRQLENVRFVMKDGVVVKTRPAVMPPDNSMQRTIVEPT